MAAADDWFRRSSWTVLDRDAFRAKLARAKGDNRAQYLRIQAGCLADAGLPQPALELLEEVVTGYPDSLEVATALGQMGACRIALGDSPGALEAYAASVERMRGSRMISDAWLDYGLCAAALAVSEHYERVLRAFEDMTPRWSLWLPHDSFRIHAARALIWRETGLAGAGDEARAALAAADQQTSGLAGRPKLGLVADRYPDVRSRLVAIVAGGERTPGADPAG
jgi:tetratricopeptide (TPR) repeat protein